MFRKGLFTATLAILISGPAFAAHCPKDMAAIDAALPKAQLSETDKATVMSLRATGETQHKAGDHASSVKTLAKAMKILGIQM